MNEPNTTVTTAMKKVRMAEGSKTVGGGVKVARERLGEDERERRMSQPLLLVTSRTGIEGMLSLVSHTGSTHCWTQREHYTYIR